MKYTKGQKIYKYRLSSSGQCATYKGAIQEPLKSTLEYACALGYVQNSNDVSRVSRLGECYIVIKNFDSKVLEKRRKEEKKIKEDIDASVLPNKVIEFFTAKSNNGKFVIDGVEYSNFYGNGENRVEVCKCDFDEFKDAKMLTRRQAYSPNEPITIVKFDEPKTIEVKLCDSDDNFGIRQIENACGFCIWERKLKIFVTK